MLRARERGRAPDRGTRAVLVRERPADGLLSSRAVRLFHDVSDRVVGRLERGPLRVALEVVRGEEHAELRRPPRRGVRGEVLEVELQRGGARSDERVVRARRGERLLGPRRDEVSAVRRREAIRERDEIAKPTPRHAVPHDERRVVRPRSDLVRHHPLTERAAGRARRDLRVAHDDVQREGRGRGRRAPMRRRRGRSRRVRRSRRRKKPRRADRDGAPADRARRLERHRVHHPVRVRPADGRPGQRRLVERAGAGGARAEHHRVGVRGRGGRADRRSSSPPSPRRTRLSPPRAAREARARAARAAREAGATAARAGEAATGPESVRRPEAQAQARGGRRLGPRPRPRAGDDRPRGSAGAPATHARGRGKG